MGKSGHFDKLLGELQAVDAQTNTLAKALSAGEGGAGGEGGEGAGGDAGAGAGGGAEGGDAGGEGGDGAGGGEGEGLNKSLKLIGADGKPIEVQDGTEMLKALSDELDQSSEVLAKAMSTAVHMIAQQGTMIGALSKQVKEQGALLKSLSGEGRGRKAVLNLHEKTEALAKGGMGGQQPDAMTAGDFMLKAEGAYNSKKISGAEFTEIDVALRTRQPVDPALLRKVMVATAPA